jgi:hypothetical protein
MLTLLVLDEVGQEVNDIDVVTINKGDMEDRVIVKLPKEIAQPSFSNTPLFMTQILDLNIRSRQHRLVLEP